MIAVDLVLGKKKESWNEVIQTDMHMYICSEIQAGLGSSEGFFRACVVKSQLERSLFL